jgi:hypothetical protein
MILDFFVLVLIIIGSGVLYSFLWSWHKDKEWRRNNPDEHNIKEKE